MVTAEGPREAAKEPAKTPPVKNLKEDADDDRGVAPPVQQKFLPTGLSRAIVLGAAIIGVTVGTTLLLAGRYDLVPAPNSANGFMYRIDRLTGAVQFCGPQGCSPLPGQGD